MAYLIIGTKVQRPLLKKTSARPLQYTDCKSTRDKKVTRYVKGSEDDAQRELLRLVEEDTITWGTYEEVS